MMAHACRGAHASRGYATSAARSTNCAHYGKTATACRGYVSPFNILDGKPLAAAKFRQQQDDDDEQDFRLEQECVRLQSCLVTNFKQPARFGKLPTTKLADSSRMKQCIPRPKPICRDSAAQTKTVIITPPDAKVTETLIVNTATLVEKTLPSSSAATVATTAPVVRDETVQTKPMPAKAPAAEPTSTTTALADDFIPANSRYSVAFLLPGPPLYDYLMMSDNSSQNSSGNSSSSVVDASFMRRLSDVMELNRRQLELVSRALVMLKERIPRLDVRLDGFEVRVFIPLGVPVATVRHWLSQAGLHEREQFVFESNSSLRAAAAAGRTTTAHSSNTGHNSSGWRSVTPPVVAKQSPQDQMRSIHNFLADADVMARDMNMFASGSHPPRTPSPASDRLAAARAYSTEIPLLF